MRASPAEQSLHPVTEDNPHQCVESNPYKIIAAELREPRELCLYLSCCCQCWWRPVSLQYPVSAPVGTMHQASLGRSKRFDSRAGMEVNVIQVDTMEISRRVTDAETSLVVAQSLSKVKFVCKL